MSSIDPNFAERRLAILQELAEVGLHLVYKVAATPEPTGETVLAYQRAAKAVRQTLALEMQIAEGCFPQARKATVAEASPRPPPLNPRAEAGRERLDDAYALVDDAEAPPGRDKADLMWEFDSWRCDDLDESDFETFAELTFEETVQRVCAALGLPADWGAAALEAFMTEALPYERANYLRPPAAPASEIAANTS